MLSMPVDKAMAALTDKDKLTGIEVHHILDTLHPKPAAEVAG